MALDRKPSSLLENEIDEPNEVKEMGYKKPPLDSRFKPGQSGNPRGRPRGSKNCKTIVREIAFEKHWVIEDGKRKRRPIIELVLLSLRNAVPKGNPRELKAFHSLLQKYDPLPSEKIGCLVVPHPVTLENETLPIEVVEYDDIE